MNIKTLIGNIRKAFSQSSLGSFTTYTSTGIRHRSQEDLLKEYQNMVYVCVNLIADEVSAYRPILYRGEDARRVRVPKHPLLDLVAKPNSYMTQSEFFEAYQIYMELVGEAFIYASRGEQTAKPKQLYLLRPDKMKVVVDDQGEVTGYALRKSDGTEVPFEVNEIIHVKDFNPLNPYRGLSAVEAAILYIDTETATSEFQNTFLRNQATPSGVLSLNSPNMTSEAFNKIKEDWKEKYAGQNNAGKTLILRAEDASFVKLGLSIADINLEGITNLNEDKILKIFRVPEAMLGVTDSSGLGRANIEAIEYIFAKRTIEPKLGKLDDAMQSALEKWFPAQSTGIVVDHESSVPEDKEFKLKTISAGVDKWMTRNEARNELETGDKVNGGDFLYVNSTVFAPIDNPGRVAGNLEGDSSVSVPAEPAKSLGKIVIREHVHEHIEKDTEDATTPEQALFQALERIEQAADKKYKPALNKLLKAQEAAVIARVSSKKKQEPAATENEYEYEFSDEELESVVAILIAALLRSGDVGIKFVDVDDITEFVLQQSTRDAIFESTKRLLKSFNEETALKIQKAIAAGLAEGEDVAALTKRIEAIYKDAKGYRATRIANTEAHKAVNQGVAEAYSQAGYRRMKWVANPGACEFCRAMDGTIKEIGTPFIPVGASIQGDEGGEYLNNYVDIAYADAHPNCVIGDTKITASDTTRLMKVNYSGEIVQILTRGGRELSVTPNHVLLTDRGFVAAKFLTKSDKVIDCSNLERIISGNPDTDEAKSTIGDIFRAVFESEGVLSIGVPVTAEDFHGDGGSGDGNVDIIFADSLLRDDIEPSIKQVVRDHLFNSGKFTDILNRDSSLDKLFFAALLATDSALGSHGIEPLLFGSSLAEHKPICDTLVSKYNTRIDEAISNKPSADPKQVGDFIGALARLIEFDDVIQVNSSDFHGEVFDISTNSTLYISNGLLSSNCTCYLLPER